MPLTLNASVRKGTRLEPRMIPSILYTACIASAVGLYLLARSAKGPVRGLGTLIGLGGIAYLLVGVMGSTEGEA